MNWHIIQGPPELCHERLGFVVGAFVEAKHRTLWAISEKGTSTKAGWEFIAARLAELEQKNERPESVLNHFFKSLHRSIELFDPTYGPSNSTQVRTVCGWKYLMAPLQQLRQPPEGHPWRSVCDKCLPTLHAQHKRTQSQSADLCSSDSQ